ncbi:MAG: efflux RND transporter periplasmic adaptor subunit, partial [Planctomycetes bacterium]|nr:efflux RND transporter periplasmic adaptor subunit [Planctomycetota bacterium]
ETAARLAQAERDRDRAEALAASQAIGREQVERLRAEAAALRAASQAAATALAECERQCGETELRAPWPALVSTVEVEPGEVVATGQTVARLERTAGSEVPVAVPPALVPRLAVGQPARLQPLGGAAVDGRVVSVAAAADRSHLCEVLVESDAAIAPGSAVAVALTVAEPPTVAVPLAALLDLAGRPAVVVLAAGADGALRVHRQAVELRGVVGGSALLAPGALAPGARVAVAGHQQAVEGEAVDAGDAR